MIRLSFKQTLNSRSIIVIMLSKFYTYAVYVSYELDQRQKEKRIK